MQVLQSLLTDDVKRIQFISARVALQSLAHERCGAQSELEVRAVLSRSDGPDLRKFVPSRASHTLE